MSPEWVCTSNSTGPETCKVLSNCPCGVEAAAKAEASSTAKIKIETRCLFMSFSLCKCSYSISGAPKQDPALLQHYLIAFLQSAEHFRLRAVGDSNVDCDLVLAFLALRIGNFHGCLFIFIV